jgi:hypothetical protein
VVSYSSEIRVTCASSESLMMLLIDFFRNIYHLTSPSDPSTFTNYAWLPAYGHWQASYAYILWDDQLCYFRSLSTSVWTDNTRMLIRGQSVFEGLITWSILIIVCLTKHLCLRVGGEDSVFNIYLFIYFIYVFYILLKSAGT